MTRIELFVGLLSLLPAAFNAGPGEQSRGLVARLCTGDGAAKTLRLPVGPGEIPGRPQPGCCAKGCHSGSSRRRSPRAQDRAGA